MGAAAQEYAEYTQDKKYNSQDERRARAGLVECAHTILLIVRTDDVLTDYPDLDKPLILWAGFAGDQPSSQTCSLGRTDHLSSR